MDITQIRQQYPQYADLSDRDLLRGLHGKFYADIPLPQFFKSVGFNQRADIERQIANDPISQAARQTPQGISFPEFLAGSPPLRFAMGAAAPIIGSFQLGANALGMGEPVNQRIAELEQMRQRGMAANDVEGTKAAGADIVGLAGNALSPVPLKTIGAMPKAASFVGRAGQGAALGAELGAFAPVEQEGDYWKQKGAQTAIGAGLGTVIPLGVDAALAAGSVGRHFYRGAIEPFFQAGRHAAEGRAYTTVAGDRATEISQALRNEPSAVPGYQSSASERIASLPPIVDKSGQAEFAGLQANVAPGAPSIGHAVDAAHGQALAAGLRQFGKTPQDIATAEAGRSAITAPMRSTAIENANLAGIKGPQLEQRLASQQEALANALQDKRRFETMAAQQEHLAHGGGIDLRGDLAATKKHPFILGQTPNEPYMNVGSQGGRVWSSSAYPVEGYPRIPGRYTENAQRALEAMNAAEDMTPIVGARQAQSELTRYQLDSLAPHGQFPLDANAVASKIQSVISAPGMRSSDVVSKSLGEIRSKVLQFTNERGIIDANDLYTIRKEAGNVIKKFADENKNWDQRLTSGLQTRVQGMIDDAIEGAGGSGWKDYLRTYASKSRDIDQMRIGQALEEKLTSALQGDAALRPAVYAAALRDSAHIPQKAGMPRYQTLKDALTPANYQATQDVAATLANKANAAKLGTIGAKRASELTGTPEIIIPPTLSRVGMIARVLARSIQGKGTARMDREMARDMLVNPSRVADLMDTSRARSEYIKSLVEKLRRGGQYAIAPAAMQGE